MVFFWKKLIAVKTGERKMKPETYNDFGLNNAFGFDIFGDYCS